MSHSFRGPDPQPTSATDGLEIQYVPGPAEPAGSPAEVPAPRHRPFNGFLRLKDPIDLAGSRLGSFSLNLLIPLTPTTRAQQVAGFTTDLYHDVYRALQRQVQGVVGLEIAAFDDVKIPNEPPRSQIRATLRTARESQVTTLFRCYSTPSHIYVAADSYALGPLNWVSLLLRASLVAALLFVTTATMNIVSLAFCALVFVLLFGRAIRGVRLYGWDVGLRGAFHRSVIDSSFDRDDCLMYLKSLMPTVVKSVRESARRHDIDVSILDESLAALEVNYYTSYQNSGSGVMNVGGVMGNVTAGVNNRSESAGGAL